MPTCRTSNKGSPHGLGPPARTLVATTFALAIAAGAAHGQSSDNAADAGEPKGEISFVEMIRQANKQYEDRVSAAIARGGFDEAREHVGELESVIPGSPHVKKLTTMIDEAFGATARAELKVRGAIVRGEFDAAKEHVRELATVIPHSPRAGELQREIDQARATATVIEQEALEAVATG